MFGQADRLVYPVAMDDSEAERYNCLKYWMALVSQMLFLMDEIHRILLMLDFCIKFTSKLEDQ